MRTVTAELLLQRGACPPQVDLFRKTFYTNVELTVENLGVAKAAGLQVRWLIHLLDEPRRQLYNQGAQAADGLLRVATAAFDAEYLRVAGAADDAFQLAGCNDTSRSAWVRATRAALRRRTLAVEPYFRQRTHTLDNLLVRLLQEQETP